MKFTADFHIHSHFSIATSKLLTPEHLDRWGRIKGVKVVGTGDFSHPGWLAELKEKLIPAEPGLFRLKPELQIKSDWSVPETEENSVRFLLTAEISNIYKKSGKVRKIHNVIFAPDFETVEKIQRRLKSLEFNITSDGRPILGLDSRDLLEMALEASPDIFFVPAHIWTPWFSALGDKSGFDRIDECYGDLSGHIHAVETGLSSDPAMNWLCSHLDRYALISNSDAHSPEKLGREANRFDADLSYPAILSALSNPSSGNFLGTLEFFPQEGKYHHDGHRKCGISWTPDETDRHREICPVCGRKVTVGVLNRVHQLSDRKRPEEKPVRTPFQSMIPLIEILSEIHGSGVNSKQVVRDYASLVQKLGSEPAVLLERPLDDVKRAGGERVAEAVRRMRAGEVFIEAGYDGEYGKIKVFGPKGEKSPDQPGLFWEQPAGPENPSELREESARSDQTERMVSDLKGEAKQVRDDDAFDIPIAAEKRPAYEPSGDRSKKAAHSAEFSSAEKDRSDLRSALNAEQRAAAEHDRGPAMVLAGPGTGKTRVLTQRISNLIRRGVPAERILAFTFTNKAADEIKARISAQSENAADRGRPTVSTFHAFGYSVLKEHPAHFGRSENFSIFDEEDKERLLKSVLSEKEKIRSIAERIRRMKRLPGSAEASSDASDDSEFTALYNRYESLLQKENGFDFDDLISKTFGLFRERSEILQTYRERYAVILVDEYQDVDAVQYGLVRLLAGDKSPDLWVVGDPDQSIYGFRGASPEFIRRFREDYPDAVVYPLIQSYRCSGIVIRASGMVLKDSSEFRVPGSGFRTDHAGRPSLLGMEEGIKIRIVRQPTDRSEAEFIARTIESMAGGLRFFSMDSGVASGDSESELGLSDFAVLCRIGRQMDVFEKAFHDHGIPYQKSDTEPFHRKEPVRSVVGALKVAVRSTGSEFRVLGSGLKEADYSELRGMIGRESVRDVVQWIASQMPEAGKPEHRSEIEQLVDLAEPFEKDVLEFLKSLALGAGPDPFRPDIEAAALMTLHAAKGLEFACVFIPGCEDGLLPYRQFERQESDPDEERRLLYVGMTRAKRHLFLSHADKRILYGRELSLPRSPFLDAIEEELVERGTSEYKRRTRKKDSQMDLF